MTLRKAGSRSIVIDGQPYRWRIRRKATYGQGAYADALIFAVQHAQGGSVLRVVAEGPRPDNWLECPGTIITPVIVADAVRNAITNGWPAGELGPVFTVKFKQPI